MSPQIYEEMARLERVHWWFVGRRNILRSVLNALQIPNAPQIVEIGCGTGGNIPILQDVGTVIAVEMNEMARNHVRKHHDCLVLPGYLPDHLPELPAADLLCLFDVLEHVEDDLAALKTLRKIINPQGKLVLTVPAYGWLWGNHDIAHHHQRRYCARSLRNIAELAGWRVNRIGYFNTWLLPVITISRIIERLFPTSRLRSDAHLPVPLINRLLTRIFSSEALWLRRRNFPCGVSILAVLVPSAK